MFNWFRSEVDNLEKLLSYFTTLRDKLLAHAEKEKQEATDLYMKADEKIERAAKAAGIANKIHEIVS